MHSECTRLLRLPDLSMLLDFEIANCTRRCATTGRTLAPAEAYYSILHMEGGGPMRRDYAVEAWSGPPDGAFAWWHTRAGEGGAQRGAQAPQDVLLDLFTALAVEPSEAEFRYVLGLLLLRRRIVKLNQARRDEAGEVLVLDCPRREEQFELRVAPPAAERMEELERRLGELVYGPAA